MWWIALAFGAAGAALWQRKRAAEWPFPGLSRGGAMLTPALKDMIRRYAEAQSIPLPVLMTWIQRESGFNPRNYNPEPTAIHKWSCAIAGDAGHWGKNGDYGKAVEVCRVVKDNITAIQKILVSQPKSDRGKQLAKLYVDLGVYKLWTFGSYGLMQVSRIGASERGGYRYDAPNANLFDPETNLKVGTSYIASTRDQVFPGRTELSDVEWSTLRAAYVGGVGILKQRPLDAEKIANQFLATLEGVKRDTRYA